VSVSDLFVESVVSAVALWAALATSLVGFLYLLTSARVKRWEKTGHWRD
jgi:hypothetical protein